MAAPDSSIVVDNPEFEYDEGNRPVNWENQVQQPVDELSVEERREMTFLMYNNLKQQAYLLAAFKNSILPLTCGSSMRNSLHQSLESQITTSKSLLLSQTTSPVTIDPALLQSAKTSADALAAAQSLKGKDELPELFCVLSDDESICPPGTSAALEQAVENGTPITMFVAGEQIHATKWDGQLFAQFNPKLRRLEVVYFNFTLGEMRPEDIALFDEAPRSKRAMRRMFELQARFQVSHMRRINIDLDSIAYVSFASQPLHSDLAILTLDLQSAPSFQTRRINSTVESSNCWRSGRDFTVNNSASQSSKFSLIGYTDVLQYLLGMMVGCDSRLNTLFTTCASPANPVPAVSPSPVSSAVPCQRVVHRAAGLETIETEFSDSDGEVQW